LDITIYHAQTGTLMQQELLPALIQRLPVALQSRALRYQSELSAYNYVIGRLLLKKGLDAFGCQNDLEKIEFHENGKPYLSDIHFNISHSDHQVICAFTKNSEIGVDLEKIKPIDFEDFTSIFSKREWEIIKSSGDPIRSFYWFWTRKESIIKALGFSLNYLHKIELDITLDHVVIDCKRSFLRDLDFGYGYMGALCSQEEIGELEVVDHKLL